MSKSIRLVAVIALAVLAAAPIPPRRRMAKPDNSRYAPAAIDHDFNGDFFADLLFRNPKSGTLDVVLQIGMHPLHTATVAPLPADATVEGTADFNGDGRADILIRNGSDVTVWLVNNDGTIKQAPVRALEAGYHVGGIGDVDGDGQHDLVVRNDATNKTAAWLMNGTNVTRVVTFDLPQLPPTATLGGVSDINGDGIADLVFTDKKTNNLFLALVASGKVRQFVDQGPFPAGYVLEAVADFDGDLKGDLFYRNKAAKKFAVALLDGAKVKATQAVDADEPGTLGAVCDLDFDGKYDLVFQRAPGTIYWYGMKGTTYYAGVQKIDVPGGILVGTR